MAECEFFQGGGCREYTMCDPCRSREDAKDATIERMRGLLILAVDCVDLMGDRTADKNAKANYRELSARIDAELKEGE